jgi:hypothetical protein
MLYAISDLHMGDCGPRDNFVSHEKDLWAFLDMVEDCHAKLVICGDLFELWQSNISKVLTKRISLLDRLARMQTYYVLGNHDADLLYFIGNNWLTHPFFTRMTRCFAPMCGDIEGFYFTHGHEADAYCASDVPGLGRITAIYTGLAEDKNGGPMHNKYQTVESKVLGPWEKAASLWGQFRGKPSRDVEINRFLRNMRDKRRRTIVCGHTHTAGRIGNWLFNCGTWAEGVNSFVRIEDGVASVHNWANREETPNLMELPI